MKNSMMHLMIAAAALAAGAGVASAQTMMKADIQMTFRAGNTLMQPGQYEVTLDASRTTVRFHNVDTKQTVSLIRLNGADAPKAWREANKPVIAFACAADGKCSLTRMWDGRERFEYKFLTPKPHSENVAEVLIPVTRAD